MMQQEQKDLLQALYEKYWGVLRMAASKYGLSQAEADDAVQDTFCIFMEMYLDDADRWDGGQIKATLAKILRNRCMDYFRAANRHPNISIQDFIRDNEHLVNEPFPSDMAGLLADREDLERLREGVQSMSLEKQAVVALYMLEERPMEEVCRLLHLSEPACRMRVSRIRRFLTEWMKDTETA